MKYSLVVIGASMGGLDALRTILSVLPSDFSLPVAVVLHRASGSNINILLDILSQECKLQILEPEDKSAITKGTVAIAPSDYHLLVEDNHWAFSAEGAVNNARPSIDVLFESAAYAKEHNCIAVVLTGASDDGAVGAKMIHNAGGRILIQSSATSYADTMPEAAKKALPDALILGLWDIAPKLVELSRE